MESKSIINILYDHSGSKTLSQFSDWIKEKTTFKILEPNLSRWLSGNVEPSQIYKQIFNKLLESEL